MSHSPSSPALIVSDLNKSVRSQDSALTILHQISFTINSGDSVAITGSSGSGKSTLLGLLAGLDVPTSGTIQLFGQELTSLDEDGRAALRQQQVGFVFQSFHLLNHLTALENVLLPLELAGRRDPARAQYCLERVGLAQRLHHTPKQLSGGEQQRVALARAFAGQPRILFADEPTGNLDSKTGQQIIELLFGMNQEQGTTLILVTHDEQLARRCQRHFRLEAGQLQEQRS